MVVFKPKSTTWNSLNSVVYCVLVICLQSYLSYVAVSSFQESLLERWKEFFPPSLNAKLALTILALILTPFFIIVCLFKVGNYANDGFKLGRDHALNQTGGYVVDKFSSEIVKQFWQNCCPFSQLLHIIMSFCMLLPETLLQAAEVYYGHATPDKIWETNLDFMFSKERIHNILSINRNISDNFTAHLPSVTSGSEESYVSVQFIFFAFALVTFSVRYSSVFWYTNKGMSIMFAFQLLFMSLQSLYAFTGFSILYKTSVNFELYDRTLSLVLGPSAALLLYMLSGMIILCSSVIVFQYGSHYFHEKFQLVDKKHNPDRYIKHKRNLKGPCNGHIPHSCAMVTLVLLAVFKGPILYDLVSIYRMRGDNLVLACVVVDVIYMICWIILWTVLTIKQGWLFRILDYANVGEPIFVIRSDSLLRTPSISIGSIEMKDIQMIRGKRPSSIPSVDITPSESGFDECEAAPSSEDERFELSLPPVSENPDGGDDESNSVIMRRNKNRRSGTQRVTFHETVRNPRDSREGSVSSLQRCGSPYDPETRVNVTADVHSNVGNRKGLGSPFRRSNPEIDTHRVESPLHNQSQTLPRNNVMGFKQNLDASKPSKSTSSDEVGFSRPEASSTNSPLNNTPRSQSFVEGGRLTPSVINYKPSNIETAEERDKQLKQKRHDKVHPIDTGIPAKDKKSENTNDLKSKYLSDKDYREFSGDKQPDIVPKDNNGLLYPRPLLSHGKKAEIIRRDSANYSLTSSQDTSSNDSDHGLQQQPLCSQKAVMASSAS